MSKKYVIDVNTQSVNSGGIMPTLEGENLFGGKNPNGLYVPMTDLEQEAISRLVETQDLKLIIHNWGVIENPKVLIGDHRIRIDFKIVFKGLLVAQSLWSLELELITGADESLFRETHSTIYDFKPLKIYEGLSIEMQWDIAIKQMSPDLVKRLTGAIGLTSRRQDRDTKEFTPEGNMDLSGTQKRAIRSLEESERAIKKFDQEKLHSAKKVLI